MSVELTREQRAAVAADARALVLHAGAGAGKTLTLAHRVARFAGDASSQSRIVVVTFTREATASLQRKLALLLGRSHLVRVQSFHQWAAAELPPEERRFISESDQRRIIEQLARKCPRSLGPEPANRLAGLFTLAKNTETVPKEPEIAALLDEYEERKGDKLDFDDLPIAFRDRLRRSGGAPASPLDHLFVDEYQDVNGVQDETVRLVAKSGVHTTIVGDPRQAIYAFRGGSPEHLLKFPERFGRGAKVRALTANFRASRRLIEAANLVEPGEFPMKPPGRARVGAAPQSLECEDGLDEAKRACDHVEALLGNDADPAEIAILCRARHHASTYARQAAERGLEHVALRTIHAAKGLEWDHVLLLGAREGGIPIDQALRTPESIAEERRLFYVAVTRARKSFLATWAGRAPSRFLVGFGAARA